MESSEVRQRRCRKLADLEFSSRWDGRGATERYEVREGHDLVCGLKRLLRHGSREAVHVAEKIRTRTPVGGGGLPGTRTRMMHSDPIR